MSANGDESLCGTLSNIYPHRQVPVTASGTTSHARHRSCSLITTVDLGATSSRTDGLSRRVETLLTGCFGGFALLPILTARRRKIASIAARS
ncbi:hypothetical protein FEK35_23670 [Nocardia cyriacigeorgica]|uniref:Uncharacterized protein n=1 Tax=Nocardia cyriacigeorgica TaxID=135487 RepID=A0A5R8P8W5_9NOCA|nr:hypothetical protein [Nocardia cyriacigeorgica]TLG01703.1 hypothetical protein FEK35_23670 [Nocardia cyriacigeorgica]